MSDPVHREEIANDHLLELRSIVKRFGSNTALDRVTFTLARGEVHTLLGENGAGKSTLMHVAFGMVQPDDGSIWVRGVEAPIRTPRAARDEGIGMVHQHFTTVPNLTVAENLALAQGVAPQRWDASPVLSDPLLGRLRRGLNPSTTVQSLSVGEKQRLEILKAVAEGQQILLLDEPTAVLTPSEAEDLLQWIREFAASGGSVVFITHKLREARVVGDRVTVLRRGAVGLSGRLGEFTTTDLARAMIGTEMTANGEAPPSTPGEVVVRAMNLRLAAEGTGDGGTGANFEVRTGEVLGIAAIEGQGQRELLHAIAGVLPVHDGTLEVQGTAVLIPEDRTTEAAIPDFTLVENLVLATDPDAPWLARHGTIDWREASLRARAVVEAYDVRAPSVDAPFRSLSGGNQQKFVLGRTLARRPKVLVAENPTRGLDFQATAEIHRRLRETAGQGVAVLVYSTDLDEVLALADRILVVAQGRIAMAPTADREEVGRLMLSLERTE